MLIIVDYELKRKNHGSTRSVKSTVINIEKGASNIHLW